MMHAQIHCQIACCAGLSTAQRNRVKSLHPLRFKHLSASCCSMCSKHQILPFCQGRMHSTKHSHQAACHKLARGAPSQAHRAIMCLADSPWYWSGCSLGFNGPLSHRLAHPLQPLLLLLHSQTYTVDPPLYENLLFAFM